jgi:hypothetical protein
VDNPFCYVLACAQQGNAHFFAAILAEKRLFQVLPAVCSASGSIFSRSSKPLIYNFILY